MKQTINAIFVHGQIFGESMDFPENVSIRLGDKTKKFFNQLDIDLEDIQLTLWREGDKVIGSPLRYFVVYKPSTKDWLGCFIDINNKQDGYFIIIHRCETGINDIEEESCPVLEVK